MAWRSTVGVAVSCRLPVRSPSGASRHVPVTSTSRPGSIAPEFGLTQYCLGAVVLTYVRRRQRSAHRIYPPPRPSPTLNATGVLLGFLMRNIWATSAVNGPG